MTVLFCVDANDSLMVFCFDPDDTPWHSGTGQPTGCKFACCGTSWIWPGCLQMVWAECVVSSHSNLTGIWLGWTPSALSKSRVLPFTNQLQLKLSFCYEFWRSGSKFGCNHTTLFVGNLCLPILFVLLLITHLYFFTQTGHTMYPHCTQTEFAS